MFSRNMPSEIGGYSVRSYKEEGGIVYGSLYKGKSKVGDIVVNGSGIVVNFKNDKEEMNYQTAREKEKLDEDFVLLMVDKIELSAFEDTLREQCKDNTVFSTIDDPDSVRIVKLNYAEKGKAYLAEKFKDQVKVCYNAEL